ncbi:19497_t:CDS:1, partial [Cetraspora pellucida]
ILEMFQGMSFSSKKSSKKSQNKKSIMRSASLEETKRFELSESFSERFENLEVESSSGT